jgi:TRAP-type mannitol/chloroaromatic compound transport system permease small subunit
MELLVKISDGIDAALGRIARFAAWAGVGLILVTVFDVVTRRFLVLGSTKLQELEWHLHVVLFAFLLGYAYLKDSHVRIDLIRERLSDRTQWWIELAGCLLFLIPYCALVAWLGVDFAYRSFAIDEVSASATGLSHRWIIKACLPLGFLLLGLSGLTVTLRKLVELFGSEDLRRRVRGVEEEEAERLVEARVVDDEDDTGGTRS